MNGEIIKTEQCSPNGFTGPHSQGIGDCMIARSENATWQRLDNIATFSNISGS